ncbi:unnamed protein product [Ophioblennius macclurei]
MDQNRAANVSFFDFVGGFQLVDGEEIRTAVPVVLIGLCASGAVGNLLLLLVFLRDFQRGKGSEVKALLASLASTDLLVLLLCAPVRALTYYKQTWTLGGLACSTADWFQHSCVVAKTFILAASTRAKHTPGPNPLFGSGWIRGALAAIWVASMVFAIPQMLFASVVARGHDTVCVSEMPACAADFMRVFHKVYPSAAFLVPLVFTLAYHTKALHAAVNRAPAAHRQSKVTLVLLSLSGAAGLLLLPEWATFTWVRLGYARPPVGLMVTAQLCLYACSSLSPVVLMTMYDDVRQGLVALWLAWTCRSSEQVCKACPDREGNGAEPDAGAGSGDTAVSNDVSQEEKTFPDVEHFWTGRRNTHVEVDQDPVPWEKEEKMV